MTTLTFTETVHAPASAAYAAFTQNLCLNLWLCNSSHVNAEVGGHYFLSYNNGFHVVGEYTALEKNERVAFTWRGKDDPITSAVNIIFKAQGEHTVVHLEHAVEGEGAALDKLRSDLTAGWQEMLPNLKYALAEGLDLRFMRRPMMGVYITEISEEQAERLHIPDAKGMIISGTVEGLAAQKAGFIADDVMVEIDGKSFRSYQDFNAVIPTYKAGDTVQVTFYRDGAKHTTPMTFSERVKPHVAATLQELVTKKREADATVVKELRELFAHVPEEFLNRRPELHEWSANEVIAHLIHTERYNNMYAWAAAGGDGNLAWPDNNDLQLVGLLAVYPTSDALLAALASEMYAADAVLSALPDSVFRNKAVYGNIAAGWDSTLQHSRSHHAQIKHAIEAAQAAAEPVAG